MTSSVRCMAGAALAAWLATTVAFSAFAQGPAAVQKASPIPAPVSVPQSLPQSGPAEQAPVAAVEAKPVTDPIVIAVLRVIEDQKAQGSLAREPDLLAALVRVYTERDRPFWTGTAGQKAPGLLPNARSVVEEMRRADDWGLNGKAFEVPGLAPGETSVDAVGAVEVAVSIAVLKYGWHARGGRIDPTALSLWLDARTRPLDVAEVLTRIAASSDPAETLRRLHPRHPQFEMLRQAYLKARGGIGVPVVGQPLAKPAELLSPGPLLKPGMRHPDIAVLRRRLDVPASGDDANTYDAELADAVRAFLRQAGLSGSAQIGAKARAAFNASANAVAGPRPAKPGSNEIVAKRLLANMERWRWLPEDLGRIHIWNNLPEFEMRVVKDGQIVHQERIIIGKPETQTPVFSDAMRVVVFQPDWGVPNSIKIKDLLPKLQNGDEDVLDRKGMRIAMNGKTVDASKFDWDKVDIRSIPIVQDPGPSNPLGQIKFLFPNKHDVYMHDTPNKGLFNQSVRTFSHGCIRVRNPRRLAELVFGEDQGWDASEIETRLQAKSPVNARVPLTRRIPVHNAYFTVVAGENGSLRTINDIYGHDRRIIAALDGVPASQIAQSDPARKLARELQEIAGDPSDSAGRSSVAKTKGPATTGSIARAPGVRSLPGGARSALGGPVGNTAAARPRTSSAASGSFFFGGGTRGSPFQNRILEGQ
jgi:L,D-transpeptidase YcbB